MNRTKQIEKKDSNQKFEDFQTLSHQIINYSNLGLPLADFLQNFLNVLVEYSGCNAIEIWIRDNDTYAHCKISRETLNSFQHEVIPAVEDEGELKIPDLQGDTIIDRLLLNTLRSRFDSSLSCFTNWGSFWTGNIVKSLKLMNKSTKPHNYDHYLGGEYKSLTIIPIIDEKENIGLLQMMKEDINSFTEDETKFYESITQTFSLALVNQRSRAALRERIKEITCLYDITKVTERLDLSIAEMLQKIVKIIPPAWQYPKITSSRIILDGLTYTTTGFQETNQKQTSTIIVNGKKRGSIEVIYTERRPELNEGPFLKEERNLIDTIARQLSHIVERNDERESRSKLQEQLRHADRLATVGQLVAGVAHELNEPINSILGFAQLMNKDTDLPDQPKQDIRKIETASLHAREIIRKLMLFSRQTQPKEIQLDLNKVIEEGLYFFKSRCDKAGINVKCNFSRDIPKIIGDPTQLNQVLINLIVNSMQAMPDGGDLTITTLLNNKSISLIVEDTGVGMSQNVIDKIFLPFFTTKDVNEGTGLGLAVVHGIVSLHKGSIRVESIINQGTRFKIELPITQL